MEPIDFVRVQPPFDRLDGSELEQVAQVLEPVHFVRGSQILARGGPPSHYLYLIREGSVRLESEGQVTQVLEEGELFGYASLLSRKSPAFDAVAQEETLAYQIPASVFHQLVERSLFAEFFCRALAGTFAASFST